MEGCRTCGLKAVKDGECKECYSHDPSQELDEEYPNYEAYLREQQMERFSTFEKDEEFGDFKPESDFFEVDPDWKPIVTKEEVLDFSKKEYWED